MKLKTSKDLIENTADYDVANLCTEKGMKIIQPAVLRQEAIKWIKDYDNKINIAIKNNYESMAKTIMHTKEEFMKFFNISEEDLKNANTKNT